MLLQDLCPNEFVIFLIKQGDTSGDYRKLLIKLCGGNDWKRKIACSRKGGVRGIYWIKMLLCMLCFCSVWILPEPYTCTPCQCFSCYVYTAAPTKSHFFYINYFFKPFFLCIYRIYVVYYYKIYILKAEINILAIYFYVFISSLPSWLYDIYIF